MNNARSLKINYNGFSRFLSYENYNLRRERRETVGEKRFETVIALEKLNGDLIDSWNKICRGKLFRKIDRSRSDRKKGCIERYTIVEGEINVQKLIILAYINIR